MGVASVMLCTRKPAALSARTADSRPGPVPLTSTSTFFTPSSAAAVAARSLATLAANGVLLREPRKPEPPAVAQERALPWRSVIVMMVLLKEAWIWAIPSTTDFLTFLRVRGLAIVLFFLNIHE